MLKEIRASGSWGSRLSSLVVVAPKLDGDDPVGLFDLLDPWSPLGLLLGLGGSIRSVRGQNDATGCIQGPRTCTADNLSSLLESEVRRSGS